MLITKGGEDVYLGASEACVQVEIGFFYEKSDEGEGN
jgi:hypothetical protein